MPSRRPALLILAFLKVEESLSYGFAAGCEAEALPCRGCAFNFLGHALSDPFGGDVSSTRAVSSRTVPLTRSLR